VALGPRKVWPEDGCVGAGVGGVRVDRAWTDWCAGVRAWSMRLRMKWTEWCASARAWDARLRTMWTDFWDLVATLREEWKDGLVWFTWYQIRRICARVRDFVFAEHRRIPEGGREDEQDWQDFLDEYGITCFEDIWRACPEFRFYGGPQGHEGRP